MKFEFQLRALKKSDHGPMEKLRSPRQSTTGPLSRSERAFSAPKFLDPLKIMSAYVANISG